MLVALRIADDGADGLTLTSAPAEAMTNHRGVAHGGTMAAVFARGMQRALSRIGTRPARVVSLAVDYLSPALLTDGPVAFRFDVERAGVRAAFVSAHVTAPDGRCCSRARGILSTAEGSGSARPGPVLYDAGGPKA